MYGNREFREKRSHILGYSWQPCWNRPHWFSRSTGVVADNIWQIIRYKLDDLRGGLGNVHYDWIYRW